MEETKNLSALLKFNTAGELGDILLNVDTDEEEKLIRKALSKMIKPNLLRWIIEKLS